MRVRLPRYAQKNNFKNKKSIYIFVALNKNKVCKNLLIDWSVLQVGLLCYPFSTCFIGQSFNFIPMAIRYIDTNFFKSPYIRGLKGSLKGLYTFIICDCSGAGIWAKDLKIASEYIDYKLTDSDFDIFVNSGKAIDLNNGKYFFPDFIEHQYPQGLQEKNPAHKNFIIELKKYNLIDENLQIIKGASKGLQSPISNSNSNSKGKSNGNSDSKSNCIADENFELIFPFESDNFLNVWQQFIDFRKSINKPLKKISQQAQLKKLSTYSENDATEMLLQSIANGWQGVFELKNNNSNGKPKSKLDGYAESVARSVELAKQFISK